MSWKPEISTDGGKTYGQNGQVFATKEEAEQMAADIYNRWMSATDYRAVESTDTVNYMLKRNYDNQLELHHVEPEAITESEGGEL